MHKPDPGRRFSKSEGMQRSTSAPAARAPSTPRKAVLPRSPRFLLVCLLMGGPSSHVAYAQQFTLPQALETHGDVQFVHDPAIIREGTIWYLFSTGNGPERKGEIPIRSSRDLHQWQNCGSVFTQMPEWIKKESPETKELWAPDI